MKQCIYFFTKKKSLTLRVCELDMCHETRTSSDRSLRRTRDLCIAARQLSATSCTRQILMLGSRNSLVALDIGDTGEAPRFLLFPIKGRVEESRRNLPNKWDLECKYVGREVIETVLFFKKCKHRWIFDKSELSVHASRWSEWQHTRVYESLKLYMVSIYNIRVREAQPRKRYGSRCSWKLFDYRGGEHVQSAKTGYQSMGEGVSVLLIRQEVARWLASLYRKPDISPVRWRLIRSDILLLPPSSIRLDRIRPRLIDYFY